MHPFAHGYTVSYIIVPGITSMFNAQKRIWMVTPYFIPDEMLVKAICIAARRNVDVRLIILKSFKSPSC